ncbi:MAG: hypothetical protein ABFD83_13795 [Armatimonadota bacterium]
MIDVLRSAEQQYLDDLSGVNVPAEDEQYGRQSRPLMAVGPVVNTELKVSREIIPQATVASNQSAGQVLQRLSAYNKQIRAESTCPVCGKPREGIRRGLGGRLINTLDETGSEFQQCIGGYAESYESSGLCTCERAYFYNRSDGRKLVNHPAQGGIIRGFHTGDRGIVALDLIVESGNSAQRFCAVDFDEPVKVVVLAPDQIPETVMFPLANDSQLVEVA